MSKTSLFPKNQPIKCFRCLQLGHCLNECPQWRLTNLVGHVEQLEDECDLSTLDLEDAKHVTRDDLRALSCIV